MLAAILLAVAACETRSISNSGYQTSRQTTANPFYRGELTAYDVLGVDTDRPITEEDIRRAVTEKQPIGMRKGSTIMLVQSGAPFPDHDMVAALERYYTVAAFTGMPLPASSEGAKYAQLFRLAAARGGYQTVVVYWGMLESAREGTGAKVLSWLPIIGGSIPDETQGMRIRLMMAVIDVKTGQWDTFAPEPFTETAGSSDRGRAVADQRLVEDLKSRLPGGRRAAGPALQPVIAGRQRENTFLCEPI
ncbi:hypothetical protein [Ferrovibrio sp.]|uniref:hypothetical protein n=1 Tax=Ferrovibrio sp. TaxID=1917215 RepID=UPI0035140292